MVGRLPVRDRRDLVLQDGKTLSSHCGWRLTPQERKGRLVLNELAVDPEPNNVIVVDDVLTTGSHFRAAKAIIRSRWRNLRVIGLFLARVCYQKKHCQPANPKCCVRL